jgi:arsenate reductase
MNILFMCVANSARSQIAEGIAKKLFPDFVIYSAGSNPGVINPFAVIVLKEIGIDISNHFSKSIDQLPQNFMHNLDYVITLCEEEVCPNVIAKNATKLHWPFTDPASQKNTSDEINLVKFNMARDSILKKLTEFKKEILAL